MYSFIFKDSSIKDKVQFLLLAILCCFNILPTAIQSVAIILFIFCSFIFNFSSLKREVSIHGNKLIIISSTWLLLLYLSSFYSIENKASFIFFRKTINIIVLAFTVFYLLPNLTKNQIKFSLKIMVFSNIIFVLYLYFMIIENLSISYLPELINQNFIDQFFMIISKPQSEVLWHGVKMGGKSKLFIHKTYLSLNLVFSAFCVLCLFINKQNKLYVNLFWCFVVLFMSIPVFYFVSSINIPILIFGIMLILFFRLKKQSHKKLYIFSLTIGIIFFFVFSSFIFNSLNKVNQVSLTKKINHVASIFNFETEDISQLKDPRSIINDCSRNLISESPFYGYGLGEQHIHLTNCYAEKKYFVLVEENFNSHNFYYFLLLSGGFLVFIPFLYMLFYFLKNAINQKEILFFLFLLMIVLNLFIENILTRINGILFFSLLLPLLYRYSNYYKTKD